MPRFTVGLIILVVVAPMACSKASVDMPNGRPSDTTPDTTPSSNTNTADTTSQTSESDTPSVDTVSDTPSETEDIKPDTGECSLDAEQAFTASGLPMGWTITDGDSDGYMWQWSSANNNIGAGSGAGHYWIDAAGAAMTSLDEQLRTEEFTRGSCSTVNLYFTHRFERTSDQGRVELQVDGGEWKTLRSFYADDSGSEMINLSSTIGAGAKFRVEFVYEGVGTMYWRVDDIRVAGSKP